MDYLTQLLSTEIKVMYLVIEIFFNSNYPSLDQTENLPEHVKFEFDQAQDSELDQLVNQVVFPIWTTSTHGLSRPESPVEESSERYSHLIENCMSELVNTIPDEVVGNIVGFVDVSGAALSGKQPGVFVSTFEEVQRIYDWSIKKGIVDYVLKDGRERERLHVAVKAKVGWLFFSMRV